MGDFLVVIYDCIIALNIIRTKDIATTSTYASGTLKSRSTSLYFSLGSVLLRNNGLLT
jgi:hypothetical protein